LLSKPFSQETSQIRRAPKYASSVKQIPKTIC
jgi:hypothetical protein